MNSASNCGYVWVKSLHWCERRVISFLTHLSFALAIEVEYFANLKIFFHVFVIRWIKTEINLNSYEIGNNNFLYLVMS